MEREVGEKEEMLLVVVSSGDEDGGSGWRLKWREDMVVVEAGDVGQRREEKKGEAFGPVMFFC